MPKAIIRNRIRQLRFAHQEMTQQELAEKAGCTRQTILLLEQERYVPSLMLAMRIAKLFNEPVEGVFTLED